MEGSNLYYNRILPVLVPKSSRRRAEFSPPRRPNRTDNSCFGANGGRRRKSKPFVAAPRHIWLPYSVNPSDALFPVTGNLVQPSQIPMCNVQLFTILQRINKKMATNSTHAGIPPCHFTPSVFVTSYCFIHPPDSSVTLIAYDDAFIPALPLLSSRVPSPYLRRTKQQTAKSPCVHHHRLRSRILRGRTSLWRSFLWHST